MLLYGGPGERHEMSVVTNASAQLLEGSPVTSLSANGTLILNWATLSERRIVQVDMMYCYLLDRNPAYNYWVPKISSTLSSVIVLAGYLVRTAFVEGTAVHITGDFNATTAVEIIGAPESTKDLHINGDKVSFSVDQHGVWSTTVTYVAPAISFPTLEALNWNYIDSLPEIQAEYDDSLWTNADYSTFNNPRNLTTPTSLYSSDYGFHYGTILYRGQFIATGNKSPRQTCLAFPPRICSHFWLQRTVRDRGWFRSGIHNH